MAYQHFTVETDKDGIALVTWDMKDRAMNVFDLKAIEELAGIVEEIATSAAIKGAVITSGKDSFCAGADLTMLEDMLGTFKKQAAKKPEAANRMLFDESRKLSQLFRRLETCGKPVVAALTGTALGGGFELALACHYRVAASDSKGKVGLPEVKVGLFPGAGGSQRLPRMLAPIDALPLLLQGTELAFSRAKAMGIVNETVPAADLVGTAKKWILGGGEGVQPWDREKFKLPGGPVFSPGGMQTFAAANALYRKETFDLYPGIRAVMSAVYEGLLMPMDIALRIESRYFAHVLRTPQAAAMIRSLFISMQALSKGARRPAKVPPTKLGRIGIIGAGFMGAGIAYVSARAGIQVVLIDRDQASADRGKAHTEDLMTKAVQRGKATEDAKSKTLSLITASADYSALKGCDLVIEAVFEDRGVKAEAMAKAAPYLSADTIVASNTSTLPITSLAENVADPEKFIGIHFFSPVDKMMLVEVIMGRKTGDAALAAALDFIRAIRKTPIVVNDGRGFYTSRTVMTYIREGHMMLLEGVPPAMIENAGRMAGMPVGPLSLNDEVAVDLAWKILQATKKDIGPKAIDPRQEALLEEMAVKRGRAGRKAGKGFYDYDGKKKQLWPGLAEIVKPKPAETFDIEELKQRLLVAQALETARIFEEGILTDVREADVGSILGFGFAPWAGGTLSYIDMMGTEKFVKLARKLQKKHGERFRPNDLLVRMAAKDERFYMRFNPEKPGKKAA
ncbi:MAG: 3-hydroxyacyl-CoA dehydrogenase NAD-binding domain-containing protein [Flavobacteriaceae bacterium]